MKERRMKERRQQMKERKEQQKRHSMKERGRARRREAEHEGERQNIKLSSTLIRQSIYDHDHSKKLYSMTIRYKLYYIGPAV